MTDRRDKGAHFHRCDFQVHTPRDRMWKGKAHISDADRRAYAERLVAACREKELDAIAITDHHDLAFLPYIRAAATDETAADGSPIPESERLVVFPGVELTLNVPCQAILLLDANFPETILPQVLTVLAITPATASDAKAAEPERLTSITTLEELKKKLDEHEFLRDCYIVLPNVTSGGSSTLLRQGANLKYKEMPCVGGYLDGPISKCKPGDLKILNGEDKQYGNKRIALFQTSDSRSEDHKGLGVYTTWVKWAVPTAEALRQACLAQESRISQTEPTVPLVVIRSLHVSNSEFMGPLDLYINPQYTAIIGSRGTGKSTILEYLRWALCDEHDTVPLEADSESPRARQQRLIDNTLRKYEATVEVRFEVNGVPHVVRRRTKTAEILLRIGDGALEPCTEDDIRTLLPIQAYSQKQLSRVGVRVDELNRFVKAGVKTQLDSIASHIRSLASQTRQVYAHVRRKQIVANSLREDRLALQSLSEQARAIRASLTGLSPEQQALIGKQPSYLEAALLVDKWDGDLQEVRVSVADLAEQLERLKSVQVPPPDIPEQPALAALHGVFAMRISALAELAAKMKAGIGEIIDDEGNFIGDYAVARNRWVVAKETFERQYGDAKGAATAHQSQLSTLAELEQKITEISKRISEAETELGALGEPEDEFRQLRESWRALHKQRGDLYANQCHALTALSDDVIRAVALRGADTDRIDTQLREIVKGSGLRSQKIDDLLERIASSDNTIELWETLLDELELLARHDAAATERAERPETQMLVTFGFGDGDLDRVAAKLTPELWLELALTSLEEKTHFEYRTKDQEYIPFENASAGQQATALLITLLNQQGPPLVIDQPEDDLDNQVMFEIVERIWQAKTRRQLIFSSHNANLVVNGDAELVAWCDYRVAGDFSRGHVAAEGAIDIPTMRKAITTVMEGGEKAFTLRLHKYGF